MPLVVIARVLSPGSADNRAAIAPTSRRVSGSPPVSRILSMPSPTKTVPRRTISSAVKISARGVQSMPCGGMQ
jgi:hypothetical protein